MNDDDLIAILRQEEQAALNWQSSELSDHREKALKYYNRDPYGDEEEGESKIVTSEFADTVESFMPGMMDVFTSGEEVAQFAPLERQDEQAAKEASAYIPHVLMRENDGYRILYWFIKDALMSRMGGAHVGSDEVEKVRTDPVRGWTPEQVQLAPQLLMEKVPDATDIKIEGETDPTGLLNGTISYTCKKKRTVIDNIAPEDILMSPNTRDIDDASFVGYRKEVTGSTLRKMGLSKEEIETLSTDRPVSSEEDQRQDGNSDFRPERKGSERRFWLVVAYVKVDDNDDGISEILRCVYAHAGGMAGRILERMEWQQPEAPISISTPILMPHTVVGRSLFDQTEDLQDIGSILTRGMLNNIYFTNRPRPMINARVSVTSVIDWVPGMPITVEGNDDPRASVGFLQVPSIIAPALTALEHFQSVRENRTGATRQAQGLDAETYNKTATGASILMSGAQQRQGLVARTFAETAIARLFRLIYRSVKENATGKINYYAKDDWQECDPTMWPDDMHLIVAVGASTGNKIQQMQNLMMIGAAQEKLVLAQGGPSGPLVRPEHMANTARKLVETAGFRATDQFVASQRDLQDPTKQPAPKEDPEMAKVKAQHQAAMAKQQNDAMLAKAKLESDIALEQQRNAATLQAMREKAELEIQLERDKAALDAQIARDRALLDAQLKREELAAEAMLGKYEIDNAPKPAPNGAASLKEQQVSS